MNKDILQEINRLKKNIEQAQEKLEASEFTAKAPGIKVVLQGTRQIIDIEIKEKYFKNMALLQKAVLETINNGLNKIDKAEEKNVFNFKKISVFLEKI